jgi:hypothetical protein
MTIPCLEGKIEAQTGWEDATSRSAVPARVYIQRPWRLFLVGGREEYTRDCAVGEVLIELTPSEGKTGFGPISDAEIGYCDPSSQYIPIEAHAGQSRVSAPIGILRGRPAQWWVPYYPTRTTSENPLEGTLEVEVGTLSSTIESYTDDVTGEAIAPSLSPGEKTYVT